MIVLKATQEQYDNLNGYTNGSHVLEFIKDANSNWVVSANLLNEPIFEAIHDQLNELERIEYVPKKETDET